MNTVALKAPQTVDTNSEVLQDKLYAIIEASKKAVMKLAWLFEHTPGYSERLLRDKDLGAEFRRMKF
ncbi:MAG: hypothetical protein IIC58_14420 [Proteobacteria bacterium]|nr:hypothetical protein [Pseudomonadota bacterium]